MTDRRARTTSDQEDSVRTYLDEIGRYPLLTKDDEARLAREIEAGRSAREVLAGAGFSRAERRELERAVRLGEQAWRTFVQANLRLVVSIAKRYQSSGVPLLDLVQEGNLGLIRAVDKFEWRKGFKFSTYATWWIRQAVQRGIANGGRAIRLPPQAEDELLQLRRAWGVLEERGEESPSHATLVAESGLSPARVADLLPYLGELISLDTPVDEAGETRIGDLVPDRSADQPEAAALRASIAPEVARILQALDEHERQVLALRYGLDSGDPRTADEVGALVNLSRERVRQIESRALARLRHPALAADSLELLAG